MTKLRALTAGLLLSTFSVGYAAIEADRLIDWSGDAQVSFEVQIEAESTKPEFSFAIIVTPAVEADSVEIRLNGSGTGTAPLINNGKLIFKAEQAFLNIGGENTISFVDEDGNDVPVTSIEMFQLQDTTQDVHFHKFLGKSASTRRAQPTLHSSQNNYDVTHYLVEIEPAMSSRALTGKVTMEAKSLVDGLATVALDFDDASTDSSSGTLLTISSVEMVPAVVGMTYSYDAANKWILVNIPLADRPDTDESFTIKVEYSGTPTTVASSFSTAPFGRVTQPTNGKSVVYTFGEPYGARGWFPCKDVVSDKAMVDVKITVPDPNIAVSHGNLVSTTALSGSRTEYHWSHGYPISTYLIAFAATEYAYAEDDYTALDNVTTMPVGHYVYLNSTSELAAVPVTIDVIEKFAGMFGEYPFLDEKYVTMTWGAGFGMEHTTCTSINNGNLVSVSPAGQSRRNIHEIAHQWFGDLVTPTSFDHIWLNEGWATYCEALYFEAIGDFDDYKNYVQSTWMNVTNNQTLPLVHSEADDFENALVYRKGGIVLHMLRHVVGDTAFFQGTRDYLDASALGSVDSEDFKEALEAASGKDLDNFFNDWVYGPGRPSYEWTWSQLGEELDIFVRQTGSNFFEMPIDFVVTGSTGTQTFVFDNTAQNQTQSFDISGLGKITSVSFDPDRWIYRATTTTSAPPVPTLLSVINDFGSVTVTWLSGGGTTAGFEVWSESEFSPLTKLADSSTLGAGATSFQESGILVPTTYYVRAVNSVGAPSATSDVYRTSLLPVSGRRTWDRPKVLIVDGYDRWDTQARGTNHPWAEVHGKALDSAFKNYDTCANEQVISGAVLLTDYDGVVWVLGEESTGDRTFNATEQTLVMAYLESGGKLFVSGAEIGWDIGRAASANYSPAFYNGYLKANYVADQWGGAYSVSRSAGNSMLPMTMNIAGSGDGIYFAQWLDVISPVDEVDNSRDSQAAYEYATSNVAAVMYKGSFGSSVNQGGVVYLGFPFETIISESDRNQLMQSVMDYLEIISTNGLGQEWMIF